MNGLSQSETLMYIGIAVMVLACILAVASIIIFTITGRKIKRKLNKEYGEPYKN